MYEIAFTTQFKKDFKKYLKNPQDSEKIKEVIGLLSKNGVNSIPQKMKPHRLIGKSLRIILEEKIHKILKDKHLQNVCFLLNPPPLSAPAVCFSF